MIYDKTLGRLRVAVRYDSNPHGAQIDCPTGWNDSCPVQQFIVSVEELRDLRYLLDRAIDAADKLKKE